MAGKRRGWFTWMDRQRRLETYVFEAIGSTPPAEIRAADVLNVLKSVRDEGKSRQTMIHVKTDISAVLATLWRAEQIPENVCSRVVVPDALPEAAERSAKERMVLSDEELVRYLGWEHPEERFREAALERQVMSVLARFRWPPHRRRARARLVDVRHQQQRGFRVGLCPPAEEPKEGRQAAAARSARGRQAHCP